ncbi:hypothetical protein VFPPC_00820 [Pochonia chlamydosporia 170]|uniref:Uncharacterized protein n=1 Tax=Pochonia chlamydosporia 170 TaxID=1380566 RepID=A0A179G6H0_METCM|nr:hypothetical protein VFPPC_00820 [Pochonia chlamydosporia 170]OAQ73001.2 hypothetical protein VFPPC_00820 [Pochonia chlamydosporia 170]
MCSLLLAIAKTSRQQPRVDLSLAMAKVERIDSLLAKKSLSTQNAVPDRNKGSEKLNTHHRTVHPNSSHGKCHSNPTAQTRCWGQFGLKILSDNLRNATVSVVRGSVSIADGPRACWGLTIVLSRQGILDFCHARQGPKPKPDPVGLCFCPPHMAGLSTCSLIARGTQTRYEQPYSLFSLTPSLGQVF